MKRLFLLLLFALSASTALAQLGAKPEDLKSQGLKVKRIPVHTMFIIEAPDGKTFLTSGDGRLAVVGGRWIDTFQGREFSNVKEAATFDRVDLARIGIMADQFYTFSLGTGKKEVVMFVDPQCGICRAVVHSAEQLGKDYTFKIVMVPASGKESARIARDMLCANSKEVAFQAFLNGSFSFLQPAQKGCNTDPLQKSIIAASMLGILRLPYVVGPTGYTHFGEFNNLAEWLSADHSKDNN